MGEINARVVPQIAYNRDIHGCAAIQHAARIETTMPDALTSLDLEQVPLFAGLDEKQKGWLRDRLHVRRFAEGVDVIVAGPPGEVIYILLTGTMKVYMPQFDGTDVIVAFMGPGDPVGELSMVDEAGRSANVRTMEESNVLWLNRRDFHEALLTMPVLAQNLLRILSLRLRYSTHHVQVLASLDVNQRVVRQLLAFADRYGQRNERGELLIPIRLTQGDIAELVGASRKRVNQAIVVLKRKGYIAIAPDYHITILNRQALADWL